MSVGIIGLGLIGGSIAKAIRQKTNIDKIIGMDFDEEMLKKAKEEKIIDCFTTEVNDSFSTCDFIFICTPVNTIVDYVKQLVNFTKPNCIITDVGSIKKDVVGHVYKLFSDKICFIGGHPMTGSEKSGYTASISHLFENAYYILSPMNNVNDQNINLLQELIKSIGAIPIIVPYDIHDFIAASISHAPHIIASAIVNTVNKLDVEEKYMFKLAAGGFKDITRIASSSPEMWQNICINNKDEVIKVLKIHENIIKDFRISLINENDSEILNFFKTAKDYRDQLIENNIGSILRIYELYLDVKDKPGAIAKVATLLGNNNISIKNINVVNNREFQKGALNIIFYDDTSKNSSKKILLQNGYQVFN